MQLNAVLFNSESSNDDDDALMNLKTKSLNRTIKKHTIGTLQKTHKNKFNNDKFHTSL